MPEVPFQRFRRKPAQAPLVRGGDEPEAQGQEAQEAERGPVIHSVTGLLRRLRNDFERAHPNVFVGGEVSNLAVHGVSGHAYFTLKDSQAQLRCVMWREQFLRLRFKLKDGQQAIARGRITVFERTGQLQMTVAGLEPQGLGAMQEGFRQLAEKLRTEGLTAPERKRALPVFPRCIGVVTSRDGAALRDVLRTILRRDPNAHVMLSCTAVQGDGAGAEVADAIRRLDRLRRAEVIIVARGGGSAEDLWAFNQESVARAIAFAAVPIVTGIGHETDRTIADLVADASASTPTAAAERAVPVRSELRQRWNVLSTRLYRAETAHIGRLGRDLYALTHRLKRQDPQAVLKRRAQLIDEYATRAERNLRIQLARKSQAFALLSRRLLRLEPRARIAAHRARIELLSARQRLAIERLAERSHQRAEALAGQLDALSPVRVLARGYALVTTVEGHVVRAASEVAPGQPLDVRLADGTLRVRVESRDGAPARGNDSDASSP
jgi:exodeoxyribonuclease VII large subunit